MNARSKNTSNPRTAALRAVDVLKIATTFALTASAALAQLPTPQGRLTLTSNTPVMTSDSTAATSVYYTPYVGNNIPIYNGSSFVNNTFSQLTMTLNITNQVSGCIYDLYVFLNSSVVTIGAGPAWASSGTCTTTSRGSTTQPTQLDGLWVNANSITLTNGSTSYSSISADEATYVGSVYMTANGQTSVQLKPAAASGGANNVMGLWNAYNRVRVTAYCLDSSSGWAYSSASWRAADNSNSNRIWFVDGLQQSPVTGYYSVLIAPSQDTISGVVGLNIDSTTTTPNIAASESSAANQTSSTQTNVLETFYPVLGLHFIQAVEYSSGNESSFFGVLNSQQVMGLTVSLDM